MERFSGLITKKNGQVSLVVAGGYNNSYDSIFSTEILDLTTLEWRFGPNLPDAISLGKSVSFRNSFLIIGGIIDDHGGRSNLIYEFDSDTENWIKRQEKLTKARNAFTAFLIPEELARCK